MLSDNFLFLLPLSQLCAQQWDQEGWQRLFASTWSCTWKLTLLRVDLAEDAMLFKAFAVLAVEGRPMSPQLEQLHQHFFKISQLRPGMHSWPLCAAVPWPAPCFDADGCGGMICKHCCVFWWWMFASCLQSVTHPPPMPPASSAAALSLLISGCVIWGRASARTEGRQESHVHSLGAAWFLFW